MGADSLGIGGSVQGPSGCGVDALARFDRSLGRLTAIFGVPVRQDAERLVGAVEEEVASLGARVQGRRRASFDEVGGPELNEGLAPPCRLDVHSSASSLLHMSTISYMILAVHGSLESESMAILLASRAKEGCHVAVSAPNCVCPADHSSRRVPVDR